MSDTIIPLTKRCTKCGIEKPATLEFFCRKSKYKDGLNCVCKDCGKRDTQKWRDENYDEYLTYNIQWNTKNLEKHRESVRRSQKKRRDENPELTRALVMAQYYKDHPHSLKRQRDWRKQNPDKVRLYKRTAYVRHGDAIRAYSREWAKRNPINRRIANAKRRAKYKMGIPYTKEDILHKHNGQNGRCYWCNRVLINFHIDHYIPLSRGGVDCLENIVIACPHCNLSRGSKMPDEWKPDAIFD